LNDPSLKTKEARSKKFRTGISSDGYHHASDRLDKDWPDYGVFSGEWEIGRIYQTRGPDSLRWLSMNANGPMTRSDRVATLGVWNRPGPA